LTSTKIHERMWASVGQTLLAQRNCTISIYSTNRRLIVIPQARKE
jgi:hypothetical protein